PGRPDGLGARAQLPDLLVDLQVAAVDAARAPDDLPLELECGVLVQVGLAAPAGPRQPLGERGSLCRAHLADLEREQRALPALRAVVRQPVERDAEPFREQLIEPRHTG